MTGLTVPVMVSVNIWTVGLTLTAMLWFHTLRVIHRTGRLDDWGAGLVFFGAVGATAVFWLAVIITKVLG